MAFDAIIIYDYENNIVNSFKIEKTISIYNLVHYILPYVDIGNALGELVPAFNYFQYKTIEQLGFGHYNIRPTDFCKIDYELFFNLGAMRIDFCTLGTSVYIPKQNIEVDDAFIVEIDGKISYSRNVFPNGLWGFYGAITIKNIPLLICHGNLSIGYSINDDKILMHLPIKDQGILAISLKLF